MLSVDKPKLPRGRAYVLKTSMLASVLPPASADCVLSLNYWTPTAGESVFEAEYWLPNEHRPATFFIRAASLPTSEAGAVRAQLSESVLPSFAIWVRTILGLPPGSTLARAKPRFVATYRAGTIDVRANRP